MQPIGNNYLVKGEITGSKKMLNAAAFTYVASDTINNSPNPNSWPELVSTCEKVKQSLENTIVKAWRDSPYIDSTGTELNFYDVLKGSHYGLTISGETVAYDGETLIPGKCPSFYKKDLKFEFNKLVELLGGKDNIENYEFNKSRFIVNLKDVSKANKEGIQKMKNS